jgi:hypothetical protein
MSGPIIQLEINPVSDSLLDKVASGMWLELTMA